MLKRKEFVTNAPFYIVVLSIFFLASNLSFSELYEAKSIIVYNNLPIEISKSDPVLYEASSILKLKNLEHDVHRISQSFDTYECQSKLCIVVVAKSKSPDFSVELANAVASALKNYIIQKNIKKSKRSKCTHLQEISNLKLKEIEIESQIKMLKEALYDPKTVVGYEGVEKLAEKYIQLELTMIELLSKYKEKHPEVITVKSQLESVFNKIKDKIKSDIKRAELEKYLLENEISRLESLYCEKEVESYEPEIEKAMHASLRKEYNPISIALIAVITLTSIILGTRIKG